MYSSLILGMVIFSALATGLLVNNPVGPHSTKALHHAIVILRGKTVTGSLRIRENDQGKVNIRGEIEGLAKGAHGMHVHQFGDMSKGCAEVGAHFDAHNAEVQHGGGHGHGHTGDFGNVVAGIDGKAKVYINDSLVVLHGDTSIIGRAVLVHAHFDDLGHAKDAKSHVTGNAGAPVACGVVAWDD